MPSAKNETKQVSEEVTAPAPKPKRTRKKKAEPQAEPTLSETGTPEKAEDPPVSRPGRQASILTIEVGSSVETEESRADIIWHEIHNAYRTRRILVGTFGGLEQTDGGKTLAIVDYKGFRVVIPFKEMVIGLSTDLLGKAYSDMVLRHSKMLSNMMGCEIDFTVMGIDAKSRSIVANRVDAMLRKRKLFYFEPDNSGKCRIYENRIVEARVLAVAEKAIRIEAFGVECSILARDLSWDWVGDARDRYRVGDKTPVRILKIQGDTPEDLKIQADIKSISDSRPNNLSLCRVQSKYAGQVTDVHKGVVYSVLSTVSTQSPMPAMTAAPPERRMMCPLPLLPLMKNGALPWVSLPGSSGRIYDDIFFSGKR